jgi:agmatinase
MQFMSDNLPEHTSAAEEKLTLSPDIELLCDNCAYGIKDKRTMDVYDINAHEYRLLSVLDKASSYATLVNSSPGVSNEMQTIFSIEHLLRLGALQSTAPVFHTLFSQTQNKGMFGLDFCAETGIPDVDILFLGLPWDLRFGWRGAAFGPEVLRTTSGLYTYALTDQAFHGIYSYTLSREILTGVKVSDLGDLAGPNITDYEAIEDSLSKARRALKGNALPVFLGGEHGLTYLILRQLYKDSPIHFLMIDAHDDFAPSNGLNHGNFVRYLTQEGPAKTIHLAGLRGFAPRDRVEQLAGAKVNILTRTNWTTDAMYRFIDRIPDGPIYVSIDTDALDPGLAPASKTLRGNGLHPLEVIRLLSYLTETHNVVGCDIMELSRPRSDYDLSAFYLLEILMLFLDRIILKKRNIFS